MGPLHRKYEDRVETEAGTFTHEDGQQFAKTPSTIGALCTAEPDFIVDFIVNISDMKIIDVVSMMKVDRNVVQSLTTCALQLPLATRLPNEYIVKDIASKFLLDRARGVGMQAS